MDTAPETVEELPRSDVLILPGDVATVRVENRVDGWPESVVVDYIEANGTRYESEDPSIYSVGSYEPIDKCGGGYKQSQWLSCSPGYFEYNIQP